MKRNLTKYDRDYIIVFGTTKYGRRLSFQGEKALFLHRNLSGNMYERRTLHMLTVSIQTIYYVVGIISILCGAAYKLGYENGKNAKSNRPQPAKLNSYFHCIVTY